jgi:trimethylamine--corrinoid protein Co-methyltransferase
MLRGFVVDAESIGLDLIKQVGIGGSFLGEEHTVQHMRDTLLFPELFDRRAPGQWLEDRQGMLEHAKAKVRQILREDQEPQFLRPEQVAELERIAMRASEKMR